MNYLGLVALIVRDYDEAIAFYTDILGFELVADTALDEEKRWVVVRPRGARETAVLLARAVDPQQRTRIGDQTGGRVGMFLNTDDFDRDHRKMTEAGITFETEPRHEPYGTIAVFRGPVRKSLGSDPTDRIAFRPDIADIISFRLNTTSAQCRGNRTPRCPPDESCAWPLPLTRHPQASGASGRH